MPGVESSQLTCLWETEKMFVGTGPPTICKIKRTVGGRRSGEYPVERVYFVTKFANLSVYEVKPICEP